LKTNGPRGWGSRPPLSGKFFKFFRRNFVSSFIVRNEKGVDKETQLNMGRSLEYRLINYTGSIGGNVNKLPMGLVPKQVEEESLMRRDK